MQLTFKKLGVRERANSNVLNIFQLTSGDWDDYSFKTSFTLTIVTLDKQRHEIGSVKIGYKGQGHGWSRDSMPESFVELPEGWFSLGQDVEYYKNIKAHLSEEMGTELLRALRDVTVDRRLHAEAALEKVFKDSLTRGVSESVIGGQYRRVLQGLPALTNFKFAFKQEADERHAAVNLRFDVEAESQPPTNIHVLIGRNGVGKTTLLNNMVRALVPHGPPTAPPCAFVAPYTPFAVEADYFSSVISVSFSAFDPFVPPPDKKDRTAGPAYFYIGMKTVRAGNNAQPSPPKTDSVLIEEFVQSFMLCISQPEKRARFFKAISRLESDANFEEMGWARLAEVEDGIEAARQAAAIARRMSSGHSIVLLTITKLVELVEEKSLVLLDEPESHLHPPLLSAFTRALSDLLFSRNGVAIIATHSPVVLQEVPKSSVWKLTRSLLEARSDRPNRETFGENVGVLTREVFGLEVSKSGFHEVLAARVKAGGTFASISADFRGQLGDEAQAILLALVREKAEGRQQ